MEKLKARISENWDKWIAICFLLFTLSFFHASKLNKYPVGIHAWANMDRMALARGFERNNLNFFQAQNYILNHQYPDFWGTPTESTRTAVEFPIHDYIPAVFMKISGLHGPLIFHLYILFFSFIGLFYLYKLSLLLTANKIKSLFVLVFAALAPNYIFYQGGFLPTIPSISLIIIAIYLYARFVEINEKKYWLRLMFIFTLTILARSTYAIPFLAVLGFEGIRTWRFKLVWKYKILSILGSFTVIFLSLKYNAHVRGKFGSDFLSELLPAKSWNDVKAVAQVMYENWRFSYLTYKHYLVLGALSVLTCVCFVFFNKHIQRSFLSWWGLLAIWLLGVLAFWFVMNQQFVAHDYYFLDTLFLPIMLALILMLNLLPKWLFKWQQIGLGLFTLVFLVFAWIETVNFQADRAKINSYDTISWTVLNYENADKWMDACGIPRTAKIMAMHAYGPNIPFILMDRVGYACKEYHQPEEFEKAMNWDWDYVVFQKSFFAQDVYSYYPQILEQVKPVYRNAGLIVCKRKTDRKPQDLLEFLGYNKLLAQVKSDFSKSPSHISGFEFTNGSGIIQAKEMYGFGIDWSPFYKQNSSILVKVKMTFKAEKTETFPVLVVLNDEEELKFYQGLDFQGIADSTLTMDSYLIMPPQTVKKPKLSTYIYNPNKNRIELFDVDFQLLTDSK